MIVGIGLDLVELARIDQSLARHEDEFLARILTPREREFAASRRGRGLTAHVAGRFAAKEAALKALGTGLAAGMRWHDVEIVARATHEKPELVFSGTAQIRAEALGVKVRHVSITHAESTAAAVVILEGGN